MNARPLVIDNEITGAVYIGRDVTAEREAERQAQERVVRIERAVARAEAVAEVATMCLAAQTPQDVIQLALDCLTGEIESRGGLAFMFQDDGGLALSQTSRVADSIRIPTVYDPISISTTILAFSRKAPVAVSHEEAGRAEQATMALLDSPGLLVVPLQASNEPLGALYVLHDDALQLENEVLAFAATIGRQCAQALERIRILEELEQTRARLAGMGGSSAIESFPEAPISPL
jgi:GAF domain-containing protein